MTHDWNETFDAEPVDLTPRPGFEAELREGLAGNWNGRPIAVPTRPEPAGQERPVRARRGVLLVAAAAATLAVAGILVAVRPGEDSTIQTPATDPSASTTTVAELPVPPTTGVAPGTTVETTVAPDTTTVPTSSSEPTPETSPPPTPVPTAATGTGVISVPLAVSQTVPLQPITTLEYGPGEEQIEVLNGEFPPPAVQYIGGVLVLEDAPQTGLTGDGVIVQTGPDSAFEDGTERRFMPITIDVAEPGGTPIGVRSLDGGGIVVVTVHDDDPRVRIRQYTQGVPGVLSEFGEGTDVEGLGDSELRITSEGATWGGDVVIPVSESNPGASRPAVITDPPFGFSTSYTIERPGQDGEPGVSWALDVEFDQEFPPGSASPLVEPFGDGVLVVIMNSSAQFAEPLVVVLGGDGGGGVYDLDGWSVADVRPDGALLTRSTPDGMELAMLMPTS